MKKKYRFLLLWLLDIIGINTLCRMLNRKKAIILYYHGVCDEDFDLLKGYDERHISELLFRKQLRYLKRKGYVFVNMTELVNTIKNKDKIDRFVVLTFDDGFRNIIENAYPIMQEFGAKGCIYLVSDLVGTNQLLWTDFVETVIRNQKYGDFQFIFRGEKIRYKLGDKKSYEHAMKDIKGKLRTLPDRERLEHLEQFYSYRLDDVPKEFAMTSWEKIKKLNPNLLEVGSHTRRHPNCTNLTSDEELEDEIYNSKIDIDRNTGLNTKHFCYPAGSYNDKVMAKVMEYGYESAVTIMRGFTDLHSDLYRLNRIETGNQFLFFKASISGSINIVKKMR